jgi:hypothetical protein
MGAVGSHAAGSNQVPVNRMWDANARLHPWVLYDLERVAWLVEARASELTTDERHLLRQVVGRMSRALNSTP